MATRKYSTEWLVPHEVLRVTWAGLTAVDDVGQEVSAVDFADCSVQIAGNLDGGTITIEGTLDGTNWATLTDPQGNPLVMAESKIEAISEVSALKRPRLSGAGVSTNLDVTFILRKGK